MSKIIVISNRIDNLIKEHAEGDEIFWFMNMTKLAEFLKNNRLKVDTLYFTRDVLEPTITSNLTLMLELLDNPFLVEENVVYMTEIDSSEIDTVKYIMNERNLLKWTIHEGYLTRDYITNYVLGKSESLKLNPSRKVDFRERVSKLSDRAVSNDDIEELDEGYNIEDNIDIDKDTIDEEVFVHVEEDLRTCKLKYISGLPSKERTAFAFLLAQFLAKKDKVVIVESDTKYLTMTDMIIRSGVNCLRLSIDNLYRDPESTLLAIKKSGESLILLTTQTSKNSIDYEFICNLLYYNLKDSIDYLIKEVELEDLNLSTEYICVLPNNVVDILKTVTNMVSNYKKKCKFVAVEASSIAEITIRDSKALSAFVRDLLEMEELDIPIYKLKNLKLGGSVSDLFLYK